METFANRLTNLREKHNLTITETCELLDVPYGTFYHWINGDAFPRPDTVKKIAEAFNVTTEFLMKGDPEESNTEVTTPASDIKPSQENSERKTIVRRNGTDIIGQTRDAAYDRSTDGIRYSAKDERKLQDINTVINQIKYMNIPRDRKKSIHKLMSEYRMELECKVFYGDDTL